MHHLAFMGYRTSRVRARSVIPTVFRCHWSKVEKIIFHPTVVCLLYRTVGMKWRYQPAIETRMCWVHMTTNFRIMERWACVCVCVCDYFCEIVRGYVTLRNIIVVDTKTFLTDSFSGNENPWSSRWDKFVVYFLFFFVGWLHFTPADH